MTPIEQAVNIVGGQAALARVIGVSQPAVFKWVRNGRPGAVYVLAIEKATGVSRHDLRPDIYPLEEAS